MGDATVHIHKYCHGSRNMILWPIGNGGHTHASFRKTSFNDRAVHMVKGMFIVSCEIKKSHKPKMMHSTPMKAIYCPMLYQYSITIAIR